MHNEEKFVNFLHALQQHRGHLNGRHSRVLENDNHGAHEIFQTSPFNALLGGAYDGDMTFGQLRKHGNFGVGTFNALDGELIALDGKFFQIKSDGIVYAVNDAQKTPFAVMQFFKPDFHGEIAQETGYEELKGYLQRVLPANNLFYAIRIDGLFTRMKVRSAPRQKAPYVPFVEAMKKQPVFELSDVQGTIIGFRFPDYTMGVGVPGYHLHFITNDYKAGGHVMDLILKKSRVAVEHTSNFYLELPREGIFPDAELMQNQAEAIREVEG